MIYNMSHVIGRAHSAQVSVPIHVCVFGIYGPVNKELSAEITNFLENTGVGVENSIGSVPAADNIGCY